MRTSRTALTLAAMSGLLASGCTVTDLGRYDSFESWYAGQPAVDYDDLGLEQTPQLVRLLYGPVLAIPYGARDAGRHAAVVAALPALGLSERVRAPAPSEQPARTGSPAEVEAIAAEHGAR